MYQFNAFCASKTLFCTSTNIFQINAKKTNPPFLSFLPLFFSVFASLTQTKGTISSSDLAALAWRAWGLLKHIAAPVMWEPTGEFGCWPTTVSAWVKPAGVTSHGLYPLGLKPNPLLAQVKYSDQIQVYVNHTHLWHQPPTTLGLPLITKSNIIFIFSDELHVALKPY